MNDDHKVYHMYRKTFDENLNVILSVHDERML